MGRKKIYILGFSMFIVGSILAGLAWNLSSMIFFRIIQAIAGSADYPTAMAIIAVTFTEGKERAQALGIWSASFAAAIDASFFGTSASIPGTTPASVSSARMISTSVAPSALNTNLR